TRQARDGPRRPKDPPQSCRRPARGPPRSECRGSHARSLRSTRHGDLGEAAEPRSRVCESWEGASEIHRSAGGSIEQYDFINARYRTRRYHGVMADVPALETFVAVARAGSIVAAAERLSRTQPSISARLLALEAAWQTKLFRRHARGMALTPEGARLLPLAEAVLQGLSALDRAA